MTTNRRKIVALAMVLALGGTAVGCGSDSDASGSDTTEAAGDATTTAPADDESTTTAGDDEETTTTAEEAAEPETVSVVASDYMFEGLPDSVPVGTTLELDNQSEVEIHEMVVLRIPDEETRSIDEIAALSEEEQNAIFGDGLPAMVQLQAPGGELIPALGDGTLTEPGRYAIVCFIPVGVDPAEYLAAAEASPGGPPEIPNAGPPHVTQGMYAQIIVE